MTALCYRFFTLSSAQFALAAKRWHNSPALGKYPEGGSRLREQTRETVAAVIRHLKTGKAPKEVAATMGLTWKCVQQIILRHHSARASYIETYSLRHPQRSGPPARVLRPLKHASQL